MKVRFDDIKEAGLTLEFVENATDFLEVGKLVAAGEMQAVSPVRTTLRVTRVGDLVEVDGELSVDLKLNCSRCLQELQQTTHSPFTLTFTRELPRVTDEEDGAEIELSAEDMGLIVFEGDEIELREAIEEQFLLALPVQPLCRQSCRGLCPSCGIDLNVDSCNCSPSEFGGKLDALKNFKIEKP